MGSLKRKIERAKAKEDRKKAKKAMQEKLGLFDKIPDECLSCQKPFDKTDKEMVKSWYVFVREKEGVVNLYCPDCMDSANKIIEDFIKHKEG